MDANFGTTFTCAVTDTDTNAHENHKSQRYEVHTYGWRALCDYQKRAPRFQNKKKQGLMIRNDFFPDSQFFVRL